MTPQPQPAAYWIELLEELTDCVPFKFKETEWQYYTLYGFIKQQWNYDEWEYDIVCDILEGMWEICNGQNVIDAAVRLREVGQSTLVIGYTEEQQLDYANAVIDNENQIYLYLRCNGIKR